MLLFWIFLIKVYSFLYCCFVDHQKYIDRVIFIFSYCYYIFMVPCHYYLDHLITDDMVIFSYSGIELLNSHLRTMLYLHLQFLQHAGHSSYRNRHHVLRHFIAGLLMLLLVIFYCWSIVHKYSRFHHAGLLALLVCKYLTDFIKLYIMLAYWCFLFTNASEFI